MTAFFVLSALVGAVLIVDGAVVLRRRRLTRASFVFSTLESAWFVVVLFWILDWQGAPWRWVPLSYVAYTFAWMTYWMCVRPVMTEDWREFVVPGWWGGSELAFGAYYVVSSIYVVDQLWI